MHVYDRQIPDTCELSITQIPGGVPAFRGGGWLLQELTHALHVMPTAGYRRGLALNSVPKQTNAPTIWDKIWQKTKNAPPLGGKL